MQFDTFESSLRRRANASGLRYELRTPLTHSDLAVALSTIHDSVPNSLVEFYRFCNGFYVVSPHLEVLGVDALQRDGDLIEFATFDRSSCVAFDITQLNDAGEWDIINHATGFRVTHTLASFLTNKTWAWIDRQRPVWRDEFGVEGALP